MHKTKTCLSLKRCKWLDLEQMRGSAVMVTGGTGLVGVNLLGELAKISEEFDLKILALVRNKQKAQRIFAPFLDRVELIFGDVLDQVDVSERIDHLIHGAGITSSNAFIEKPVETIWTSVAGTHNMLEFGRQKRVRSMVFLSSMEVYGSVLDNTSLSEAQVGYLNPLNIRSSYPESKRMCENLCVSYEKEYGVPVKIARLAQTFGTGIQQGDDRAAVQFLRSALRCEDIQIKTSGNSARMYLHTFDAVTGVLTLLLLGENGGAYNIANRDTYCSVRTLAETIVKVAGTSSRVYTNTGSEAERCIYPPESCLCLNTSKIEALGWIPYYGLSDSILSAKQCLEEIQ